MKKPCYCINNAVESRQECSYRNYEKDCQNNPLTISPENREPGIIDRVVNAAYCNSLENSNITKGEKMNNETSLFCTRDRESGNVIEQFTNLADAEAAIARYEKDDKEDWNYTPDFYEVARVDEHGDWTKVED